MKKIIILLIFLLGIGGSAFYFLADNPKSLTPLPQAVSQIQEAVTESVPSEPAKLTIGSINVDAEVEYVGLDSQKRMDVPKNAANVAWYNLGPKPGEVGSSVMAGHLDDPGGNPAVFWDLSKIRVGETVTVTDSKGNELVFEVKRIQSYDFDKFPLQEVFGSTDGKKLNLLTCEGSFDKAQNTYTKRTVVYSELE